MNKWIRRSLVAAICLGGVVLVGRGCLHVLQVWFAEDLYTRAGTLDYYLSINSAFIKNVPKPGAVAEVEYYSSCGDGPKPPAQGVSFLTDADVRSVNAALKAYLEKEGYGEWDLAPVPRKHKDGGREVTVSVEKAGENLTGVWVRESYSR